MTDTTLVLMISAAGLRMEHGFFPHKKGLGRERISYLLLNTHPQDLNLLTSSILQPTWIMDHG
jgi:hypothetical protein